MSQPLFPPRSYSDRLEDAADEGHSTDTARMLAGKCLPVAKLEENPLITVCDACLQASCWHGIFMCDRSQSAGITQKRRSELEQLGLEHPDYWLPTTPPIATDARQQASDAQDGAEQRNATGQPGGGN